jgi:ankyrin repeat protein
MNPRNDEKNRDKNGYEVVFLGSKEDNLRALLTGNDENKILDILVNYYNDVDFNILFDKLSLRSPLTCAIDQNMKRVVNYMLTNGADPNFHTDGEDSPLAIAFYKNNVDIINELIKNNAIFKIKTNDVCVTSYINLLKFPSFDSVLSKLDKEELLKIFNVVITSNIKIEQYFKQIGQIMSQMTSMNICISNYINLVDFLWKQYCKNDKFENKIIISDKNRTCNIVQVLEFFLQTQKFDVNQCFKLPDNKSQPNLLMLSVLFNNIKLLEMLLINGANPNIVLILYNRNRYEQVTALVSIIFDVAFYDPFKYKNEINYTDRYELANLLLKYDANYNIIRNGMPICLQIPLSRDNYRIIISLFDCIKYKKCDNNFSLLSEKFKYKVNCERKGTKCCNDHIYHNEIVEHIQKYILKITTSNNINDSLQGFPLEVCNIILYFIIES